ncbi:diaminopimelate epimerase [Lujinxingia sediminis]|uniref:Diaminopimelate epimerase n=1 Tax=Lujinxingia sediminis TaxID=2480984 RepID=A0ABY0CYI4_9DELT|nr:diaminopimelate epimerase [Lujinxingia sediminis]RVU48730.1 diaminopimelate epimerase [Lujinxingia sediminis]
MMDFAKFHGLGNDFIVVAQRAEAWTPARVRAICDRHLGVGADGVLLLEQWGEDRLRMIVFNQDGSRPQMCGNGVRCAAAYAQHHWDMGGRLIVESDAGPRACEITPGEHPGSWEVNVAMGPARIGERHALEVEGHTFAYTPVDMGNPHAVIFNFPGDRLVDLAGEAANAGHPDFAEGVNLEFVEARGDEWRTSVYERGVGRTRACGTGACAVAAAIWDRGLAPPDTPVVVALPGGRLTIETRQGQIWMQGPAQKVFTGTYPNLRSNEDA